MAIDSGDSNSCTAVPTNSLDQRNYSRAASCDRGAFEYGAVGVAQNGNNPPIANDATFSVDEGSSTGTTVGTYNASESDAGQSLTYQIAAGNDSNAFSINSSTGEITVG